MANELILPQVAGTFIPASHRVGGVDFQRIKLTFGADNVAADVTSDNPFPVTIIGALGNVSVSNFPATQPVSIAGNVPVTGTFFPPTQPVSIASSVAVTGPLTALELSTAVVNVASDSPLEVTTTSPIDLSASTLAALETVSVTGVATETTLATVASVVKLEDAAHVTGDAGIPMLALRYSTDAPTTNNDGDYTNLKVDEEGRLKVASKPASYADITGDITAIQATIGTPVAGGTVSGDVSRASNVMMFCTGTFAGVNATFEGSLEATGDANWFGVQAVRSNANTIETATGVLAAQPIYAWELSVNALARVRVRATARTSGTQSWRFKLGTYATEPIPAAQATATQPVSGTVTANGTSTITPTVPTSFNLNSAATTNLTVVKASAGTLYALQISNNGAAAAFVKFYNKTTAPVLATDIPFAIIPIPAASSVPVSYGVLGLRFGTGIAYAITNLIGDLDATAVAAGQIKIAGAYI
jgi:hypothetical protein